MKPEEINGEMYQPVLEDLPGHTNCNDCVFSDTCIEVDAPCMPGERDDGLSVYFIELDDQKNVRVSLMNEELNTRNRAIAEAEEELVHSGGESICNHAEHLVEAARFHQVSHDQQAERIKELEEFVQMVAAGDSAEDSMKGILVHTYIHNAKTLLGQYPHEQ